MVHNCVFVCILVFIFFFFWSIAITSKDWVFRLFYVFIFFVFFLFIFFFSQRAFPFFDFGYIFMGHEKVLISFDDMSDIIVSDDSLLKFNSLIPLINNFNLWFFENSKFFEFSKNADVSSFEFLNRLQELKTFIYGMFFFFSLILLIFLTLLLLILDYKNTAFILFIGLLTAALLFVNFLAFSNLFIIKEVAATPNLFLVDLEIISHITVGKKSILWYNEVALELNKDDSFIDFFSKSIFGYQRFALLSLDKPLTLFEFFLLRAKLLKYDAKRWPKVLWVGRFVQGAISGAISRFFKQLFFGPKFPDEILRRRA